MKKIITILSINFFGNQRIVKAIQASTFLLILSMLFSTVTIAQDAKGKREILKSTQIYKLQKLKDTYSKKQAELKKEAENIAKTKGWELTKKRDDGSFMELIRVNSNGSPMYYTTYNLGAAKTTRANALHTGGSLGLNLNGEGITFGLWDEGGVDEQHQEWDNNITRPNLSFPAAHSTHVAGTMVAKGVVPEAKGMASKANIISYSWTNDATFMASEAANGLLLSNHSYGWFGGVLDLQEFGRYDDQAKSWDEIQYNAPYYLVVKAAGNDRTAGYNPSKNGYDVLNGAGSSKNTLVVAAVEEVPNYTGPSSVTAAWFSSMGPTDDGRIKPDISAKGVDTYSATFGGTDGYLFLSGTSMAAPNVTGSLGLVQQHYNHINGHYMKAATLKALAIATAEETGIAPGPDYEFGWGLLNVEKAVLAISNEGSSAIIEELRLNNGSTYSTTVNSNGAQPLAVTIAWTDAAGSTVQGVDNATLMLINDLDIRVSKNGTTFKPWILNPTNPANGATKGDNFRDNVERINVDNTTEGAYTITVTHKGSLGSGQDFSLIITGAATGAPPVCEALVPGGLSISNVGETTATISWNGVNSAASYDYRYRVNGTSSWTTVNTNNTAANLTGLSAAKTYQIQVRTNCPDASSSYSSSVTFTTGELCIAKVPSGLAVSGISGNEAIVSWNAVSLISKYNYRYKTGNGSWTTNSTSETSVLLSGLNTSTNYQVQVNSACANGDVSGYSGTVNFTTTLACTALAPENVNVTNISATSANISWNVVPGADNYYQVRYKPSTRSWFSLRVVFTNSVTLNSLSEGTTYDVQIKARCSEGGDSQITAFNFTTSGDSGSAGSSCDNAPQNFHTNNVSGTTATIAWNAVDNGYAFATLYQIRYKPSTRSWYSYRTSSNVELTLTGLTVNTTYDVQVKAYCKGGSSPSANLSFATQVTNSVNSAITNTRISKEYIVYPNPNNGSFSIDFKEKKTIVQSITVYDMFGLKVFHKNYNRELGVEQYSLGLVKSGLYKIAIRTEHSTQYETLLIEL